MKKHLLVLAVISAMPFAAQADDAIHLIVYGKARVGVEFVNNGDDSKGRVVNNVSRLGFKGSEKINDTLTGMWQIESAYDSNGDNAAAGGSGFNTRNTFLALQGNFGKVLVGYNDTPYKQVRGFIAPFADSTVEETAIFGKGAGQSFHTRQKSTIQYYSPSMGAFDFALGLASNKNVFGKQEYNVSANATYKTKEMYLGLGLEQRQNLNAMGDDASAARLVGGYQFGAVGLGLGLESIKFAGVTRYNATSALSYKVNNDLSVAGTLGYGKTKNAATSKSMQLTLGGTYKLSKRTELTAYASSIQNDTGAATDFTINGLTGVAAGKDPMVVGFGINHSF